MYRAGGRSVELFGQTWAHPFGIAPMGLSALSAYRGDIVQAQAACAAGIPMICERHFVDSGSRM